MYKTLRADRDAYISNRVIKGTRELSANVGAAGSLDLYKLYGKTLSGSVPNTELTRLLVHYDLSSIRTLISQGKLDPSNPSFNATLKLFDVYGGQPTPNNFSVSVFPLSRSFDEGLGRDIVFMADKDACNFLSGSRAQGQWLSAGCELAGGIPGTCDYITASTFVASGASLGSSQFFRTGEENLEIDVTLAISATLANIIPDEGFRISLEPSLEVDERSYFVKRFASRTAFNESKHPALIIRYDDSIQDDSQALTFDSQNTLFFYNYDRQEPKNLVSGSSLTPITGSNSLQLKLSTEISGGYYTLVFPASQHMNGTFPVKGVYSSSFVIPSSDSVFAQKLAVSGSVRVRQIWSSLDDHVTYQSGSFLFVRQGSSGWSASVNQRFTVSAHNLQGDYKNDQTAIVRIHLFDIESPYIKASRLPVEMPGSVFRDVHYQIRCVDDDLIVIPFDRLKNSTRLSSDAKGMFFPLDMSNLSKGRTYTIEVMLTSSDVTTRYDTGAQFTVSLAAISKGKRHTQM